MMTVGDMISRVRFDKMMLVMWKRIVCNMT
jgi:hypothetical protein